MIISNKLAIDFASLLIIFLTIGFLLVAYLVIHLIINNILLNKLEKNYNPILSKSLSEKFTRSIGLPLNNIKIAVIQSTRVEAYSFSKLSLLKKNSERHFIVISTSLIQALSLNELICVVAHEYGHLYREDTFWVPFLKVLGLNKLVILNKIAKHLIKNMEFEADKLSALWTRKPAHLASALLKTYDKTKIKSNSSSKIFVPTLQSRNNKLLLMRIERLLNMQEGNLPPFKWPKW